VAIPIFAIGLFMFLYLLFVSFIVLSATESPMATPWHTVLPVRKEACSPYKASSRTRSMPRDFLRSRKPTISSHCACVGLYAVRVNPVEIQTAVQEF